MNDSNDIKLSVCHLVKKLYKQNKNIIIIDNDNNLNQIDKLLWSFEQNSFLPHKIFLIEDEIDTPIILLSQSNITKLDLFKSYSNIINNSEIPLIGYSSLTNIYEFILNDENHKIICRNKYIKYKNNNFEVIHKEYNE